MTASFIPSLLKELDDVTITTPAVGHGIRYDGSKWINQQLSHLDLTNVGVNTHAQIDTHISTITDPHGTTLTQTNLNLTGAFDISNTAPAMTLTDTTISAKSLKIDVDANIAQIREKAGASGSLLSLNLANNRVGIKTDNPVDVLDCVGGGMFRGNSLGIADERGMNISYDPATFTGILQSVWFGHNSDLMKIYARTLTILPGWYADQPNFFIGTTGNVGIGTLTPDTRLDIEDGAISFLAMTAPASPVADKAALYVTATGTTPNRVVALKVKFQNGTEVTLASVTV